MCWFPPWHPASWPSHPARRHGRPARATARVPCPGARRSVAELLNRPSVECEWLLSSGSNQSACLAPGRWLVPRPADARRSRARGGTLLALAVGPPGAGGGGGPGAGGRAPTPGGGRPPARAGVSLVVGGSAREVGQPPVRA